MFGAKTSHVEPILPRVPVICHLNFIIFITVTNGLMGRQMPDGQAVKYISYMNLDSGVRPR